MEKGKEKLGENECCRMGNYFFVGFAGGYDAIYQCKTCGERVLR